LYKLYAYGFGVYELPAFKQWQHRNIALMFRIFLVISAELISPMYEQAVKLCPQNEEYISHLFMSYVRQEKFQEMQRVHSHDALFSSACRRYEL